MKTLRPADVTLWPWLLFGVALAYLATASAVFQLRHPWATENEQLVYLPTALRFGTVAYEDARPRTHSDR